MHRVRVGEMLVLDPRQTIDAVAADAACGVSAGEIATVSMLRSQARP